ncbi:response regulator [Paenibacillus sp. S150]|uniref:response regulator n=1 Tax=Paenibacillus sp. S150 TaxID=2749826 RepID=UPI001C572325|nr:response regulator [Paenibacillus sp. S150]MBW4082777.1 response regulator [Paenibacillus sp. S150]
MRYRVLLIDDEPSSLEGLQLWIDWESLGFEICGTGSNGLEGLKLMKQLRPDLVITDVNMPLMNGLEMVAAWRREAPEEIRFAVLSGYSEFEYAQTAIRYGIHHYLLKPIFPEEAAEELREIHQELEQDRHRLLLNQIAASQEAVVRIKALLHHKPEGQQDLELPSGLPEGVTSWNVLLLQTVRELYAGLRGRAAVLIAGQPAMYAIDLEAGSLAVVFGYGCQPMESAENLLAPLLQDAGMPLFMAVGAPCTSPLYLSDSYRTAKEALMHFFYQTEPSGLMRYRETQARPFSYHYDHIRLLDAVLAAVNTLDLAGFRQAVMSAAGSFREQYVAPEVVKKLVIHIMYRMVELIPDSSEARRSILTGGSDTAGITHTMLSLTRLVELLSACGEACIDLLIQAQHEGAQGIVQEINHYIGAHYRESLTIQKLAEIFYLHPVYLGQLLRKKNGIHFNEQLHSLRIEEAVALLRQNAMKLSEIAEQVGYANYGQFLKQFEKKMGMGPGQYRNAKF